ncbi:MAG: helix-turn-helix transcriptional regulator [Tidjanibacter sp.]|nr:helix-turn-helix transcriptional regulator [Tidjanibacter sp.]MBQ4532147.1 helix-turn-helix transcriptional regulator [Alistipes sp.]
MTINERFEEVIKTLYRGNKRAFAQSIGVSATVVENVVGTRQGKPSYDVLEKVCANANISAEWLLTGRGDMIQSPITPEQAVIKQQFPLRSDLAIGLQSIPLYELDATAGLVSLFDTNSRQVPISHLQIPDLPPCDGALYVRGDSMYPLLKSGDIVLYKEIPNGVRSILWGEMYLLSFTLDGEDYITIKYIQKGDDERTVRLVSHNPHHSPKDIPADSIRALALVKASVRFNTMG